MDRLGPSIGRRSLWGPPSAPVPGDAITAGSSGSGIPRWAIRGFGVIIVLLMLWLFVGNGWTVITGGYVIDQAELEDEVTIYLEEDDEGKYVVTCDEPGRVQPGDRGFCQGTASDGREYQVEVTYQSNGGYVMEATLTGGE